MNRFIRPLTMLGCGLLLTILLVGESLSAVAGAPGHSGDPKHHREREADGAYSPRGGAHHAGTDKHDDDFDHQAILGSKHDAEEFDDLPPEEAKKRLLILIKRMDLNKNQKIEHLELQQWIIRSFSSLSAEESSDRFKDIDANKDGFVDWNEYLLDEYEVKNEEELRGDSDKVEEVNMLEEDKYLFNSADTNKKGKLTQTEFLGFTHPEENPGMKEPVVQNVLRDKDTNKDGKLEFKEFLGSRGKDMSKDALNEEKSRFDDELDKNLDGMLDKEEIAAWIIPSNEDVAKEETEHLFGGSDDDHDGVLTFDEILAHHDLFVGSEATDYGDHLHNIHKFQDEL